jgi:hypothetical protein
MKCPTCGFENAKSYGTCTRCGRFLGAYSIQTPKSPDTGERKSALDLTRDIGFASRSKEEISHTEIASKMKLNYLHGTRDANQRNLEVILKLLDSSRRKDLDIHVLLQEAADVIHDQFRLRWVAIGLKNPRDGLFRYETLVGFRDDAMRARKRQTFTAEDFTDDAKYKGRPISDHSKMYFEEDKPYMDGSEATFNRPALLKSRRHGPDDALEADYLDVHIFGTDKELVGWIETSGTILGKLPDVITIKSIEVVASIIGAAVVRGRR